MSALSGNRQNTQDTTKSKDSIIGVNSTSDASWRKLLNKTTKMGKTIEKIHIKRNSKIQNSGKPKIIYKYIGEYNTKITDITKIIYDNIKNTHIALLLPDSSDDINVNIYMKNLIKKNDISRNLYFIKEKQVYYRYLKHQMLIEKEIILNAQISYNQKMSGFMYSIGYPILISTTATATVLGINYLFIANIASLDFWIPLCEKMINNTYIFESTLSVMSLFGLVDQNEMFTLRQLFKEMNAEIKADTSGIIDKKNIIKNIFEKTPIKEINKNEKKTNDFFNYISMCLNSRNVIGNYLGASSFAMYILDNYSSILKVLFSSIKMTTNIFTFVTVSNEKLRYLPNSGDIVIYKDLFKKILSSSGSNEIFFNFSKTVSENIFNIDFETIINAENIDYIMSPFNTIIEKVTPMSEYITPILNKAKNYMLSFINLTPEQLQDEINVLKAKKQQIMNENELLKLFNIGTEKKDILSNYNILQSCLSAEENKADIVKIKSCYTIFFNYILLNLKKDNEISVELNKFLTEPPTDPSSTKKEEEFIDKLKDLFIFREADEEEKINNEIKEREKKIYSIKITDLVKLDEELQKMLSEDEKVVAEKSSKIIKNLQDTYAKDLLDYMKTMDNCKKITTLEEKKICLTNRYTIIKNLFKEDKENEEIRNSLTILISNVNSAVDLKEMNIIENKLDTTVNNYFYNVLSLILNINIIENSKFLEYLDMSETDIEKAEYRENAIKEREIKARDERQQKQRQFKENIKIVLKKIRSNITGLEKKLTANLKQIITIIPNFLQKSYESMERLLLSGTIDEFVNNMGELTTKNMLKIVEIGSKFKIKDKYEEVELLFNNGIIDLETKTQLINRLDRASPLGSINDRNNILSDQPINHEEAQQAIKEYIDMMKDIRVVYNEKFAAEEAAKASTISTEDVDASVSVEKLADTNATEVVTEIVENFEDEPEVLKEKFLQIFENNDNFEKDFLKYSVILNEFDLLLGLNNILEENKEPPKSYEEIKALMTKYIDERIDSDLVEVEKIKSDIFESEKIIKFLTSTKEKIQDISKKNIELKELKAELEENFKILLEKQKQIINSGDTLQKSEKITLQNEIAQKEKEITGIKKAIKKNEEIIKIQEAKLLSTEDLSEQGEQIALETKKQMAVLKNSQTYMFGQMTIKKAFQGLVQTNIYDFININKNKAVDLVFENLIDKEEEENYKRMLQDNKKEKITTIEEEILKLSLIYKDNNGDEKLIKQKLLEAQNSLIGPTIKSPFEFKNPVTKFVQSIYTTCHDYLSNPKIILPVINVSSLFYNIFTNSFFQKFTGGAGAGFFIQNFVLKDYFYRNLDLNPINLFFDEPHKKDEVFIDDKKDSLWSKVYNLFFLDVFRSSYAIYDVVNAVLKYYLGSDSFINGKLLMLKNKFIQELIYDFNLIFSEITSIIFYSKSVQSIYGYIENVLGVWIPKCIQASVKFSYNMFTLPAIRKFIEAKTPGTNLNILQILADEKKFSNFCRFINNKTFNIVKRISNLQFSEFMKEFADFFDKDKLFLQNVNTFLDVDGYFQIQKYDPRETITNLQGKIISIKELSHKKTYIVMNVDNDEFKLISLESIEEFVAKDMIASQEATPETKPPEEETEKPKEAEEEEETEKPKEAEEEEETETKPKEGETEEPSKSEYVIPQLQKMYKLDGADGIVNNLFSYYLNNFINTNGKLFEKYNSLGGDDFEEVIMPYFLDFLIRKAAELSTSNNYIQYGLLNKLIETIDNHIKKRK